MKSVVIIYQGIRCVLCRMLEECIMNLLCKEEQKKENLGLIANLSGTVFKSERPVDRLLNGIKKTDVYFECPPIKVLSANEKREMEIKTFQLGNLMFHSFENDSNSEAFVHPYSLRFIKLDAQAVEAIEIAEKKCAY